MDVCIDFEFVIGDFEFFIIRADAEYHAVAAFFTQYDAFLEISGIHRMREVDCRHNLLRRRIGWVLIELRFGDFCDKRCGAKLCLIIFQPHLLGKQAFLRQRYHHFSAHRPIRFRIETQRAVVVPLPCAVNARLDSDTGTHFLAHARECSHRIAEFDQQRFRLGVGLIDRRGLGRSDFVRHFQRFGQFVVPHFARHATGDQRDAHAAGDQRATPIRPHPACERDGAEPERVANAAQPARRLPLNVADKRAQHASQKTSGLIGLYECVAHGSSLVTICFY